MKIENQRRTSIKRIMHMSLTQYAPLAFYNHANNIFSSRFADTSTNRVIDIVTGERRTVWLLR